MFLSAGTSLLVRPLPPAAHEGTYQAVLGALNIKGETAKERVDALLKVPVDDILSKLPPGLPFLPILDGEMFPFLPTHEIISSKEGFSRLPGAKWCKEMILGNCAYDVRSQLRSLPDDI